MMRSTFSATTTIASSTTMPITSTMPNIVSTVIEQPRRQQHAERAQQRDRHDDGRDQRVAPVLQEHEHHDEHERDNASSKVSTTWRIEILMKRELSYGMLYFTAFGGRTSSSCAMRVLIASAVGISPLHCPWA